MKSFSEKLIRRSAQILVCAVFAAIVFGGNVFAQGKVSILVQAETTVAADQISVGDIAGVTGSDANAIARIKQISLGFSPRVGAMREIPRANILMSLAAAGFNENDLSLSIPATVVIKRAAQTISQDALRDAVEKAILPQLESENVTAKITKIELPANVDLPIGTAEIRVINFSGITNYFTPTVVSIELRVDGKVIKRVAANVEVEASADVYVLKHAGTANARIAAADVRTEKIKLEKSLTSYLRTPAALAGRKLLKNLPESTPLTTDVVAADTVVKPGDTVSIVAKMGNAQISIAGEARSGGRIGDRIAVKNTQSGVILQAQVVDEATVKLNF
jgi:flagella basal body P-ring formation protein FlgA